MYIQKFKSSIRETTGHEPRRQYVVQDQKKKI